MSDRTTTTDFTSNSTNAGASKSLRLSAAMVYERKPITGKKIGMLRIGKNVGKIETTAIFFI
jgi:hypothetical protein